MNFIKSKKIVVFPKQEYKKEILAFTKIIIPQKEMKCKLVELRKEMKVKNKILHKLEPH